MKRKKYTAQEMRDMADCISNIKQSEMPSWKEGEIITGGDLCRSAEMLRQAADVRERIGELLITYHSCPDQRDLLNFILTGHEEGD